VILLLLALGDDHTVKRAIEVDELKREYRLHVPPGLDKTKPAPLVLVLHGGGGNGKQQERFTKFSDLSDTKGFIVVYPDAVDGNWNDGRENKNFRAQRDGIDDVKFIGAIIDEVGKEWAIDPKRVFSTGASNGGLMSHRLGIDLSDRIVAIAPVIGGIAEKLEFKPAQPVAVLIMQGTKDPLVPYAGGGIGFAGGRGNVISTDETVKKWVTHNGCGEPKTEDVPDTDTKDGCTVSKATYAGKADVVFYKIDGGGHTWPGGDQYLPEKTIGKTCRDFDATTVIWEFFESHARP